MWSIVFEGTGKIADAKEQVSCISKISCDQCMCYYSLLVVVGLLVDIVSHV
jgi:hypothetical protein